MERFPHWIPERPRGAAKCGSTPLPRLRISFNGWIVKPGDHEPPRIPISAAPGLSVPPALGSTCPDRVPGAGISKVIGDIVERLRRALPAGSVLSSTEELK